MNDLATRKELVLARANLHRQVLVLERDQLLSRWSAAKDFTARHPWLLAAGAAAAGLLLFRRRRPGLLGQWPMLLTAWQILRR